MRVAGLQGAIIRFAVRFRGPVLALSCLLVIYGAYALHAATYDVFPEFAPPQVSIQTEAPGLSPRQVELLVTRPIEAAVNGVAGLDRMMSSSIQGLSVVTVYFGASNDLYRDRQLVAERLGSVTAGLPANVQPPLMAPLTSSTGTVLMAGLTSRSRSLMELRSLAEWTIRPSLLSVTGVAGVEISGGEEQSIAIMVHPDRLQRFGLGLDDVLAAARQATGVLGAGFISTPNQRITLQTEGQSASPRDIARTVLLRRAGVSITLGDVADVVLAPEPAIGGATIMGEPGVVLNITAQYGANTLAVSEGIEAALGDLRPALARDGVVLDDGIFRPANFIVAATRNLRSSLVIGAVLVVLVLFLFLFNLRTAAICCTAIPLSLLAAVIVVQELGLTLNTMTLGGLALALGEVVDDAVIGTENIARRLRENRRHPRPQPAARIVLEASFEVRSAVVYATFAVILVFLPVVTLSGISGRLFAPLGITYILAVLASLAVAITVTPALALLLLPGHTRSDEPPVVHWTRRHYERLLLRLVRMQRLAIAATMVATLAGAAVLPFLGATFLPDFREGHFVVHMTAIPGTSLTESLRMGARVSALLARLPFVRSVAQRAGRAELTADTHGTHQSEIEVDLRPGAEDEAGSAKAAILRALAAVPGMNFAVNTFLTERIEETLSGFAAPVAVDIYGNDLAALAGAAQDVARVLGTVPGARSVQMQSPLGLPQLTVRLRRADLQRWGFRPVQVLERLQTAYGGTVVGQSYDGERVLDVVVRLAPGRGDGVLDVAGLKLRSADGGTVLLRQVADVRMQSGPYQIQHDGGRRLETVTLDVQGRDVASFVRQARSRIAARVALPAGTYVTFAGTAAEQAEAQRDLAFKSLVALVGIVLLLSAVTRNWRNLLLVLVNLPFALVGGLVAVVLTGGVLSLGSMIGFVALFGITLRNSMMMIAHYEHVVAVDGLAWGVEAAVRGAADRLAAILMTSLVTGLGLLPLAIGMNASGREIEGPMALVILAGLVTSTALNLLLLPVLALRFGRFERTADEFASVDAVPL